jgi:hypothetical protein
MDFNKLVRKKAEAIRAQQEADYTDTLQLYQIIDSACETHKATATQSLQTVR